MELIYYDGFENYSGTNELAQRWTTSGGNVVVITSDARTGSRSCRPRGLGYQVAGSDEHATFILGCGVRRDSSSEECVLEFRSDNSTTQHVTIVLQSDGSIEARRGGATGTLLDNTNPNVVTAATWHYLTVVVALSDTVGSVAVWLNGTQQIDLSNTDTKNGGTKTVFDSILFNVTGTGNFLYIDDFYLANASDGDDTPLLDARVPLLAVDGAGSNTDMTSSTSDPNWQNVDEVPPDDATSYNYSSTVGDTDTYALEDFSSLGLPADSSIEAVTVVLRAQKSDAGSKSIRTVIVSGATTANGNDEALTADWNWHDHTWTTDPNTGVAWTPAGVTALEAGAEVR